MSTVLETLCQIKHLTFISTHHSVCLDKTNNRQLKEMIQDTYPAYIGLATNCLPPDADQPQSLAAVMHVLASGAPPYKRIVDKENQSPNDVHCDINMTRVSVPEQEPRRTHLTGILGVTKAWVKVRARLITFAWRVRG